MRIMRNIFHKDHLGAKIANKWVEEMLLSLRLYLPHYILDRKWNTFEDAITTTHSRIDKLSHVVNQFITAIPPALIIIITSMPILLFSVDENLRCWVIMIQAILFMIFSYSLYSLYHGSSVLSKYSKILTELEKKVDLLAEFERRYPDKDPNKYETEEGELGIGIKKFCESKLHFKDDDLHDVVQLSWEKSKLKRLKEWWRTWRCKE